jgi:hypothetical protein
VWLPGSTSKKSGEAVGEPHPNEQDIKCGLALTMIAGFVV